MIKEITLTRTSYSYSESVQSYFIQRITKSLHKQKKKKKTASHQIVYMEQKIMGGSLCQLHGLDRLHLNRIGTKHI